MTATDDINIKIQELTREGETFYLEATTMGGVVARKQLFIQDAGCIYKINPRDGQDQDVVLPYTEGQKVKIYEELQKEFVFLNEDPDKCQMDTMYTFNSAKGGQVKNQGAPDTFEFTMDEANKGKKQYFFSLGSAQ